MLPALQARLNRLNACKQNLVEELRSLPDDRINARPASDAWSMLEVAEHLMRTESEVVNRAALVVKQEARRRPQLREHFGALMVWAVMLSPKRIRVPDSARKVKPAGTATLLEVELSWGQVRAQLRDLLDEITLPGSRVGFVEHPISGLLTPEQTLRFLEAHSRHHGYQLKRLRQFRPAA